MTILSIFYFLKRQAYWIQIYVGCYSIYFSVITAKDLYVEFEKSNIYILALPLLLFIYGIWEIYFDEKISEAKTNVE